ncbi:MAG TPA: hypothetical protein VFR10_11490, partial [bacterium]|nr:hypothetical protein [bacterium]
MFAKGEAMTSAVERPGAVSRRSNDPGGFEIEDGFAAQCGSSIRVLDAVVPSTDAVIAMLVRANAFVLLSSVLLIPPSFAGYEFSVSADSTNPFVNTAPPANGIRNLYLWATCAEDGLSAFEAEVTGSLQVLGFSPLHGVMNAGTETALLLAVPGCPQGTSVNALLGYWIVQDTGGSICLGPATESEIIACVDCTLPNPNLWDDPRIIGFASSGNACDGGANVCGGEELTFGASFQETAVLEGSLAYREPWSPTEPRLVFNGKDGLYSFDAEEPGSARKISEKKATRIEWSPDGQWLLFIPMTTMIGAKKSLDAISIEGGRVVQTLENIPQDMGHFVWATDGYIYYWNSNSAERG